MAIAIGHVSLRLHCLDAGLLAKAGHRYAAFLTADCSGLDVCLQSADQTLPAAAEFVYSLDDASLCLEPGRARLLGVRHEHALDSLLRILLSVLLLPRRGLLLHAATVIRDGRAYVFTGRSGAGKSTVARLSPTGNVLTDEISLLRHTSEGWQAYGTPFWGEFRAEGRNLHAPVEGIYVLTQASVHRLEPLSPLKALRALLPNVLFFDAGRPRNDALLHLLLELVHTIPIHRLDFSRDTGFWSVVAQ